MATKPDPDTAERSTVTPVTNNRESMVQLRLPGKQGRQGLSEGALITLLPGRNFVPTRQWDEARKGVMAQVLLRDKIAPSRAPESNPERVGQCVLVEGKPVSADNPLRDMDEPEAVAFLDDMFDVPTMKRLQRQEDRPAVAAALRSQIDKMERPRQAPGQAGVPADGAR